MNTFKITKNSENSINLIFNYEYFLKNCNDATIDFDECPLFTESDFTKFRNNESGPTFNFVFDENNKPHENYGYMLQPIFDESEIAQLFNDDVLAALIAADSRFANDENPY